MNVSYVSFFAMFLMYLLAALFGYLTFYGEYYLCCFLLNSLFCRTTVLLSQNKRAFTKGSKYTQVAKCLYKCTPKRRSVAALGLRCRIETELKQIQCLQLFLCKIDMCLQELLMLSIRITASLKFAYDIEQKQLSEQYVNYI